MTNKIAIASCHDKFNFGSMLQAYATERAIAELGFDVETIDKRGIGKDIAKGRNAYYLENLFNAALYKAKIGFVGHRIRQKLNPAFGREMGQRYDSFRSFENTHFHLTSRASSFRELSELVSSFDAVVVGSDQLWLPVNIAGDYFTLSFVKPPVRKVSYATSFGVSSLSEEYLEKTKRFLSDFDAISVRETTGEELVEQATGRACTVVCDPTMLMTADQWGMVARQPEEVPADSYIFCYFMGKNLWNRECARALAKRTGCKIVAIAHPDEYVKYDDGYADFYPWSAGPAEWVWLISHASYVCTDSFHGSVFSNLFGVPFFSFRRHENMGAQSTNSRIDTLLDRLGDIDRICESREAFDCAVKREIDFTAVEKNISQYRVESTAWLADALKD